MFLGHDGDGLAPLSFDSLLDPSIYGSEVRTVIVTVLGPCTDAMLHNQNWATAQDIAYILEHSEAGNTSRQLRKAHSLSEYMMHVSLHLLCFYIALRHIVLASAYILAHL